MLRKVVSSAGLGKMAPWMNINHGALDPPQTDLETSESCELIDHSSNIFNNNKNNNNNNNNNNNLSGKSIKELQKTAILRTTHTYFVKY
jgi:hypothetical protein